MSRHSEALSEANCDTLDAYLDQQEQEQRQQHRPWWYWIDRDESWISKQMSNGSQIIKVVK